MKSVDILIGPDGQENAVLIDLIRQGKLDQNRVDLSGLVESVDNLEQFLGCRFPGKLDRFRMHAQFFTGAGFDAHV